MWRIDGATAYGTQFFIVPVGPHWDSVPRRVDLFIPSQEQHPHAVRNTLQSHFSVSMTDSRQIANLGISHHLCRALEQHCRRDPGFSARFKNLPFGSKLSFDKVAIDTSQMELLIHPAYDLERRLKSLTTLRKEICQATANDAWPNSIDISQLRLESRLHDSTTLVTMKDNESSLQQPLVFKSCTDDPQFLYHEVKMLLTCPPHGNVLSAPLFLVTNKSSFGGKRGVCGFIVPYFPIGSMRDILPLRRKKGILSFQQQIKWSRQIASALEHIYRTRQTFYSDLRPDNVLLKHCPSDPSAEDATLIDFEQRGNWYEWCPPEILYRMYLDKLQPYFTSMLPQHRQRWEDYTRKYLFVPTTLAHASHGGNAPWFSLSLAAQEKASVYCLGLLLYCIFEGVSNVRVSLSNAFRDEPDISFPRFKRTPPDIQRCIKKYTIGAPGWTPGHDEDIVRRAEKLYPRSELEETEAPEILVEQIFNATTRYWNRELQRAEDYFKACARGIETAADQRPTLSQVLQELEGIERASSLDYII
ncbi:hypothetical protein LTS15_008821 [Exophiala xenobiotica]|nr:hypothetical protein LTS15_008821 [Exophiala xenobiotica]